MSEYIIEVEHLKQYFPIRTGLLETKPLKAVDDVSFAIKPGETLGLVGESGCGKTTTGRSIIRLYDITSGNVWFKGQRIAAGTQSYRDRIIRAKTAMKTASAAEKEQLKAEITEQKAEIAKARYDHRHADTNLVTQIQMIFQDPIASLDPRMTVMDTID